MSKLRLDIEKYPESFVNILQAQTDFGHVCFGVLGVACDAFSRDFLSDELPGVNVCRFSAVLRFRDLRAEPTRRHVATSSRMFHRKCDDEGLCRS